MYLRLRTLVLTTAPKRELLTMILVMVAAPVTH